MTITLTREEAQKLLDGFDRVGWARTEHSDILRARLSAPEPEQLGEIVPADEDQLKRIAKLVEPEPEPVTDKYLMEVECTKCGAKQDGVLTVTAPQQRNWQGLTDEEMFDCLAQTDGEAKRLPLGFKWFAEAIEAKLREKNA
jgi:hypothetical protein